MSNSEQERRPAGFVDTLVDIVRQSRDLIGQPPLTEDRLLIQARAWMRFLHSIPTIRLQDCYEAWAQNGARQPLRHRDLLDAWFEIQQSEKARTPAAQRGPIVIDGQVTYRCQWCLDAGYQIAVDYSGREGARGCACEACPPAQRSSAPLCPPEWVLDVKRGHWRRVAKAA